MKSVVQVIPRDDYKVYVYFLDGYIKLYDAKPLVSKGIFRQIQDPLVFKNSCTVMNHTLAWDLYGTRDPQTCLDLDPDQVFEQGLSVDDPLEHFNGKLV